MIEIKRQSEKYKREYAGMILYCSYWHKYSLILHVEGSWVTELDGFGKINHGTEHEIRTHCTSLRWGDKLYTVKEFYEQVHVDNG